jgi:hypothetical protein
VRSSHHSSPFQLRKQGRFHRKPVLRAEVKRRSCQHHPPVAEASTGRRHRPSDVFGHLVTRMLGRRSSPRQVPTTSTVWLTSVHRGLRSGARTKLAATKMDEGRLWPPPETGDGQVIGVELRGLEPLTPTLPVRTRSIHCCASASFPQVTAIRFPRRTPLDGPELSAVATKMAPHQTGVLVSGSCPPRHLRAVELSVSWWSRPERRIGPDQRATGI